MLRIVAKEVVAFSQPKSNERYASDPRAKPRLKSKKLNMMAACSPCFLCCLLVCISLTRLLVSSHQIHSLGFPQLRVSGSRVRFFPSYMYVAVNSVYNGHDDKAATILMIPHFQAGSSADPDVLSLFLCILNPLKMRPNDFLLSAFGVCSVTSVSTRSSASIKM